MSEHNEASTTTNPCPHCGKDIRVDAVVTAMPPSPLPQLMYDVKIASELIPYRPAKMLLQWLARRKHEFPARYRTVYLGSRARSTRVRILSANEIFRIRDIVLRGPGKNIQ